MEVEIGKPVVTNDGEQVGTVDRLIIDPDRRQIREFLVQEGTLLRSDRIVEEEFVKRVDEDGTVHLSLSADEVESLPEFVEHRYVAPTESDMTMMPHAWVGGVGGGPLFWGAGPATTPSGRGETAVPGRGEPRRGSFFEPAPVDPAPMEPEDSLDADEIVIDEGTNVVGRDGDKLGTIEEITYGDDGRISAFTVKAGLIFSHNVRIPIDWVENIDSDAVQLSVTADEAESQGAIDQ